MCGDGVNFVQEACGTRTVACDGCKKQVMRRILEEHRTNVCPVLCAHLLTASPLPPPLPTAFPFDGSGLLSGVAPGVRVDDELLDAALAGVAAPSSAVDSEDKELQRALLEVSARGIRTACVCVRVCVCVSRNLWSLLHTALRTFKTIF